jgi:hypothetical protein
MTMEKLRSMISGLFGGGKKETMQQPGTQQPGSMGETPGRGSDQQPGGPTGEAQRQGQELGQRFGGQDQESQGGGENQQGRPEGMMGEVQERRPEIEEKADDLRDKLP